MNINTNQRNLHIVDRFVFGYISRKCTIPRGLAIFHFHFHLTLFVQALLAPKDQQSNLTPLHIVHLLRFLVYPTFGTQARMNLYVCMYMICMNERTTNPIILAYFVSAASYSATFCFTLLLAPAHFSVFGWTLSKMALLSRKHAKHLHKPL